MYSLTRIATPDKNISKDDDQEDIITVIQQEIVIQKDTSREYIDKTHSIGKPKPGKQN